MYYTLYVVLSLALESSIPNYFSVSLFVSEMRGIVGEDIAVF